MTMEMSGVYAITNMHNGKVYVGSAINLRDRWRRHLGQLLKISHHSIKLQRAWNKYGPDAFQFRPLLVCAARDLVFYEQRAIDVYASARNGYNISPTAGSTLGIALNPETHAKMVALAKARKHSPETRAKLSAINRGKKLSAETCAMISALHMGNKYNLGRKASEETRAKLRERAQCRNGRPHSQETKDKLSALNKGKTYSAETRAKKSAALVAHYMATSEAEKKAHRAARMNNPMRFRSPETRAKISATKRAALGY